MKRILSGLIVVVSLSSLTGCTEKPPSVRVFNERTTKANVQVKSSSGNTINLNDVVPGQTTNYQNITEGRCEATAVIQNESVSPTTTFTAVNDYTYTVVIANTNPPTLSVDSQN